MAQRTRTGSQPPLKGSGLETCSLLPTWGHILVQAPQPAGHVLLCGTEPHAFGTRARCSPIAPVPLHKSQSCLQAAEHTHHRALHAEHQVHVTPKTSLVILSPTRPQVCTYKEP